jgi:hypothetical protein
LHLKGLPTLSFFSINPLLQFSTYIEFICHRTQQEMRKTVERKVARAEQMVAKVEALGVR